jgi:hypothetical protein
MSIPRKKIQRESILVPHHMHLFPISTVLVYIGNELLYVLEHVDEWTCSLRRDVERCQEGLKQREESLSEEQRDLLEREYQVRRGISGKCRLGQMHTVPGRGW